MAQQKVSLETVLDTWAARCRAGTATIDGVATALGMTRVALKRALARARRAGDPRAVYLRQPPSGADAGGRAEQAEGGQGHRAGQ